MKYLVIDNTPDKACIKWLRDNDQKLAADFIEVGTPMWDTSAIKLRVILNRAHFVQDVDYCFKKAEG
jgi:hypothetical protein